MTAYEKILSGCTRADCDTCDVIVSCPNWRERRVRLDLALGTRVEALEPWAYAGEVGVVSGIDYIRMLIAVDFGHDSVWYQPDAIKVVQVKAIQTGDRVRIDTGWSSLDGREGVAVVTKRPGHISVKVDGYQFAISYPIHDVKLV